MFRFLHTADLHLDSPMIGLSGREGAVVDSILGASRRACRNLVDLAIAEQVAFVVIAGDVYDRDWKGYETGLFFRKCLARLVEAGIAVFLISGNHDAASVISRKLSLPAGVTLFSSRAPETVEMQDFPVAIHGMSFPNRVVDENLVPRYPEPVPGKFNLGILHTSLSGDQAHDTYAPCTIDQLVQKGYDYWALGHIHKPGILHRNPWIVYPGNIQGRSVKECGARGCQIVTVDNSGAVADCQWHALDVARWAILRVNAADALSIEELANQAGRELAAELEASHDRLLAVRLIICGSTELHASLCSQPAKLNAEVQARADELGDDRVWIEQIRLETTPLISLEELSKRDALTQMVVESVAGESGELALPPEVENMLEALPPALRDRIRTEMNADQLSRGMQNAGQMILSRLTSKGEQA
jgi:DNA repair protein SbcD/Mre11